MISEHVNNFEKRNLTRNVDAATNFVHLETAAKVEVILKSSKK